MPPGDAYRLAKIEHYLRQSEECFQMARYSAAMKSLDHIFVLEPENAAAASLKKRIRVQLSILQRQNGHLEGNGGENGRPRKRRKGVVMVIDQDERVLIRLSETLRKYGLETVSACNYAEAVDTLGSITPDLILSEINFEGGPAGFDLFLWLRSGQATRMIPFVFHATRVDREVLIAGKRLGVDDFVVKPVDEDVVAASILNCLARARHTQKMPLVV